MKYGGKKVTSNINIAKILLYMVLTTLAIIYLFPFLWMIITSLKTEKEVMAWPPTLIPHTLQLSNYPDSLTYIPFLTYVKNTLIYCFGSVFGVIISSTLAAYGFSRIKWPERDKIFILVLSTMMLPMHVTMIPKFVLFSKIGWIGTLKPLIVPFFFGEAFYIFLLRQFFMGIPYQLSDAAKIDGCSELRIFHSILLPLVKPAIATVALFQFLTAWNDFLYPLIYLNEEAKFTVSVGLQLFLSRVESKWGMLMAASAVVTIPIIVLFFFTQKSFIQGIAMTGIKG
jgi:multiple sugar transport system permease protein